MAARTHKYTRIGCWVDQIQAIGLTFDMTCHIHVLFECIQSTLYVTWRELWLRTTHQAKFY